MAIGAKFFGAPVVLAYYKREERLLLIQKSPISSAVLEQKRKYVRLRKGIKLKNKQITIARVPD